MSDPLPHEKDNEVSHESANDHADHNDSETSSQLEALSLEKASAAHPITEAAPAVPEKDTKYLASSTSVEEQGELGSSPKRNEAPVDWNEKQGYIHDENTEHHDNADLSFESKKPEEHVIPDDSKSEIQSIMHQFEEEEESLIDLNPAPSTGANLPVFQYPPRTSSLEHQISAGQDGSDQRRNSVFSNKTASIRSLSTSQEPGGASQPPEPDPEPALAFDFHRFLEQLRHRTADPVAKFLRSFLLEFGKKQWMVHEQVKIISDFLAFITNRMAQCEVWRSVSEAEFDNAREGMEKLVMNRLYTQTFSPEIVPAEPMVTPRFRRKPASAPLGPGRKGQHQEDVERDEVLAQKVRIYGWVREEHLDMKPFGDKGLKFLKLAQQGTYFETFQGSACILTTR